MTNWDEIDTEELYIIHEILGLSRDPDDETLSEKIDRLSMFYEKLKNISDKTSIILSEKIREIIHKRIKN